MIRVHPAPEPAGFDEKVRQPGLRAIAALVGERSGTKRAKIADRPEDIPAGKLPPYWRRALDHLLASYDHICAYACVYIERVTGAASVDHFIPKSLAWNLAYEWHNYRLACSLMNTRKGSSAEILDPFAIEDGWFALELVGFQVIPGEELDASVEQRVTTTIERLGLNDREWRELRGEYAAAYWNGEIRLGYLCRRAPFVARELRRQGRLRREDM